MIMNRVFSKIAMIYSDAEQSTTVSAVTQSSTRLNEDDDERENAGCIHASIAPSSRDMRRFPGDFINDDRHYAVLTLKSPYPVHMFL